MAINTSVLLAVASTRVVGIFRFLVFVYMTTNLGFGHLKAQICGIAMQEYCRNMCGPFFFFLDMITNLGL